MTAIRTGSILTDSWNLFYNILSAQVSDISTSRAGSDFIFSAWPNKATVNRSTWTGYPILVLTCDVDTIRNMTVGKFKEDEISLKAQIYNKSQANCDRMANQVQYILSNVESGLEGSGLYNYRFDGSDSGDTTDPSGALIHEKTLTWRYKLNI